MFDGACRDNCHFCVWLHHLFITVPVWYTLWSCCSTCCWPDYTSSEQSLTSACVLTCCSWQDPPTLNTLLESSLMWSLVVAVWCMLICHSWCETLPGIIPEECWPGVLSWCTDLCADLSHVLSCVLSLCALNSGALVSSLIHYCCLSAHWIIHATKPLLQSPWFSECTSYQCSIHQYISFSISERY